MPGRGPDLHVLPSDHTDRYRCRQSTLGSPPVTGPYIREVVLSEPDLSEERTVDRTESRSQGLLGPPSMSRKGMERNLQSTVMRERQDN